MRPAVKELVVDASVVINLLGSGSPRELIEAIGQRLILPMRTRDEVLYDPSGRGNAAPALQALADAGLIDFVELSEVAREIFWSLIRELGDGEAAAIACAVSAGIALAVDDKKARRIAGDLNPRPQLVYSVELFFIDEVRDALPEHRIAELLYSALREARMRVPSEYRARVVQLIGEARASECTSLGFWR